MNKIKIILSLISINILIVLLISKVNAEFFPAPHWNNLMDAAFGDNAPNGAMTLNISMYDGVNFDRSRGNATNGWSLDATRSAGGIITPADNFTNPTTAQTTSGLNGSFDETNWDRQKSFATDSDSISTVDVTTSGIIGQVSYNYGFNTATYDRIRSGGNGSDIVATATLGALRSQKFNFIFNETTWDKPISGLITGQPLVDNSSNGISNVTTNTTTVVKGTAGYVSRLNVNVVGTGSTVSLYDVASGSCTGTPGSGFITTLDTTTLTLRKFNETFVNGICAVTAGAAAADISVLYR